MRSTPQSRSFGCKLIDEKGLVQACGLAHHLLCFLRDGNQCSNESFIHLSRLLLADSWKHHSADASTVSAILEGETMRFTWLDLKALILKSRREFITSPLAALDPGHPERNIISAAENNSSLSHHLIPEWPNSRRFRPLHIVLWKDILMKGSLLRLLFISLLAAQVAPHGAWAQMKADPPLSGVKGKLQSFTDRSLEILTPSGVVHVNIGEPLATYKQIPSDLSHVTSTSFVGVASIKQADGTELATQIKIFPPELRGAGEGSSMMDAAPGAMTHSRMTNGSVSRPAMSHSRMTNGTVQKGSGTTLVVHYQDGAQTISVPPNVPVTEVAREKVTFAVGDTVYAATEKLPNGMLTTDKVFLIATAAARNTMQ